MHQSNLLWTWVTILLLTFVGCSSDSASNGSAESGSAESGSAESAKAADRSAADRRAGTVFAPTVEQRRILGFENPTSQDWVSANATLSRSTTFAEGSSALSIQLTRRRAEACSSKLSLPWKENDAIGFRLLMQDPVSDGEVRVVLRSASDSEPIELAPFALDEEEPRVFHQVVAPLEHQVRTLEAGTQVQVCIVIEAQPGQYVIDDLRFVEAPHSKASLAGATQRIGGAPTSRSDAGYVDWPGLTSAGGGSVSSGEVRTNPNSEAALPWPEAAAPIDDAPGRAPATAPETTGEAPRTPHIALYELDDPDFCTTETLLPTAPFVSGITPVPNGTTVPYPICTAQQYATIINTSSLWTKNFVLMGDINLGTLSSPPSTAGVQLSGVFNGNNKTLSNYTFSSSTDAVSLFGKLNPSGVIRNLVVRNFNVTGVNRVGALLHENRGLIEHVTATNVTASGSTGLGVNLGIAGIAGVNYGTLLDVTASVNVTGVSDAQNLGGLVGRQGRTALNLVGFVTDCNVSGSVTRLAGPMLEGDSPATGGAVAFLEQGNIVNTHSSVALVSSDGRAGGLVGQSNDLVLGSSAVGPVTAQKGSVGGLVGRNSGAIQASFSTGSVSADYYVGGLVGLTTAASSSISDSYATGNVQGTGDGVGGLGGRMTGAISTSYATGTVQGAEMVGGLVGYMRETTSSVSQSWASGNVSASGRKAGGLVGVLEGQVDASYARGNVTGSYEVGGLLGNVKFGASVQDSASTGSAVTGTGNIGGLIGNLEGQAERCFTTVNVTGSIRVGGLVGDQTGDVFDSYATGTVTASGIGVGGLVGRTRLTARVVRAYSAGAVSGLAPVGGFVGEMLDTSSLEDCHSNASENPGLNAVGNNASATDVATNSAAALRQQDTFTDWDFEDVWGILEDRSFPFLRPVPDCTSGGCSLGCPCPADTCTSETDCAFGQVCGEDNGGYFDEEPEADVCWDPLCGTDQHQQLCDAEGAPCGSCEQGAYCSTDADCDDGLECGEDNSGYFGLAAGHSVCWDPRCGTSERLTLCGEPEALCGFCSIPGCADDAACPSGQVCGVNAGLYFDYAPINACWDPICETAQASNCGEVDSLCGKCACVPDCTGKTCGDDASDGCGGVCKGFCDNRAGGCHANYECAAGLVCVPDGGERIGLPEGTTACLPEACIDNDLSAMDCGSVNSPCGECPTCVSACDGRSCGPDPAGCGGDCGTCSTGTCMNGQCATFAASSLTIPGTNGDPVEVEPLPDATTQEVGAIPATFAVSERGAATYEVPIAVPPGRGGLQPELSIRYASTAKNGYLGVGWSVGGLSQITRCNANRRFDGWPGHVRMDDSDKFCLDGRRLLSQGAYGEDGTEYYVEPEDFSKIVSFGQSGTGPESFKVWTKEGKILHYGVTVEARVHNLSGGTVRSWYLNRIEDRAGNLIDITYTRHGARIGQCSIDLPTLQWELHCEDVEIGPDTIYYGGFDKDGVTLPHSREVVFHYSDEDRPDVINGYLSGGGMVRRTKLVDRIETRARGEHVRAYEFSYNNDDDEPSLLLELRECSGEGSSKQCKPPTSFDYHGGRGFAPPVDTGHEVGTVSPGYWKVFDMNGDGLDDLLIHSTVESSKWTAYRASTSPGGPAFYALDTNTFYSMRDPHDKRLLRGDVVTFPGDAGEDLYTWPAAPGGHYATAQVASIVLPSSPSERGSLTFDRQTTSTRHLNQGGPFLFDIDGDGYTDPVVCDWGGDGWAFEYRVDGHLSGIRPRLPDKECSLEAASLDIDNDGLPNLWRRAAVQGGVFNWRALTTRGFNDVFHKVDGEWTKPADVGDGALKAIDVNGDGLQDLLYHRTVIKLLEGPKTSVNPVNVGFRAELFINTGRGELVPTERFIELNDEEFSASVVIDYDNDGYQDFVYPAPPGLGSLSEWVVAYGGPKPFQRVHYPIDFGIDRYVAFFSPDYYSYKARVTVADVNGDSSQDLLMTDEEGELFVLYGRMARNNLLKRVTDGIGQQYEVAYESSTLLGGRTYQLGSSCTASAMCVKDPGPLVSGYTISQAKGIDSDDATTPPLLGEVPTRHERSFEFHYGDARRDGQGYGWLGFGSRNIRELDGSGNLIQTTHIVYHNEPGNAPGVSAYSWIGKPKEITTTTRAALSSLETGYHAERTHITNNWLFKQGRFSGQSFPYLASRRTDFFDVDYSSSETGNEIVMHRIYESFDVDEYGNQLSYLRQEGRPEQELSLAEQEVTTVYDTPDEEAWLIAQPRHVSVTDSIYPGFDRHTRTTELVYDGDGLIQNIIREPDDAYYRLITTFHRNAYNNVDLLTIADADPETAHRQTTFLYDDDQVFPGEITNSLGHSTRVVYDARFGTPSLVADPNNVVQKFAYDGFGRLRQTQRAGESTTVSFKDYDLQAGEPVPVRGAMAIERTTIGGLRQTTVIDSFGRPVEVQSSGLQGVRVDQETAYGPAGLPAIVARPHSSTSPTSQGVIEYTYDARQRLVRESHPDETAIEYGYANRASVNEPEIEGSQETTVLHYRSTKDRNGNVTVDATDFRGNLSVHYYEYSLVERTLYRYAGFGVLSAIEDTFGNVTRDIPDRYGRIATQSDPDRGTTTYTHTAFDQVATSNDARNVSSEYIYDALGRLRFLDNSRDGRVQWAYDQSDGSGAQPNALGRLTYAGREDDDHVTRFRYEPYNGANNRGLLAAIDRTINTESGPREFTTSFEYDGSSRVELVHYPAAGSDETTAAPLDIRYHYDTRGNLERLSDDLTDETYWQLVSHSQGYRVREHRLGSNIIGSVDYNPLNGNVTELSYTGQQLHESATYLYDDNRNLTDIIKPGDASSHYSYDNLDRMVATAITDDQGNTQFGEYAYDPLGRLLSKPGVGGYEYDDGDHPHAVKTAGDYDFAYDQSGNTITRRLVDTDQAMHLQYMGAFGLPHRIDHIVAEDMGPSTELEYDAFTARVVKRELAADGSLETQQLYVGDEFELTEHADGSIDYVSNLFLGQTQIARISRTEQDGDLSPPDVEYLLVDQQGTPTAVANADGTLRRTNSFTPYGAPESDLEGPGFTGHRHDLESDLIDMRGRLYDPLIARFMSPDPIISAAHLSEGLNPYSYVFNSPMNWVDPSGFEADYGGSEGAASYSYPTGCTDCSGASSDSGYNPLGTADANGYLTTTPDTGGIDAFPSGDLAGTQMMPAGVGSWSPGSAQTGDVVPSAGTSHGGAKPATVPGNPPFSPDSGPDDQELTSNALGTPAAAAAPLVVAGPSVVLAARVVIPIVLAGAAVYDATQRVFVTYTLTNPATGQVYVGRTSGYGDPNSIVQRRYASHHMRLLGFGNPTTDVAVQGWRAYAAIRGREQQKIDSFGGVGNHPVANRIRGVSKLNPFGRGFHLAADLFFGNIAPYTGY